MPFADIRRAYADPYRDADFYLHLYFYTDLHSHRRRIYQLTHANRDRGCFHQYAHVDLHVHPHRHTYFHADDYGHFVGHDRHAQPHPHAYRDEQPDGHRYPDSYR